MMQLSKLVEEYSVDNFRDELVTQIEEASEEAKHALQAPNRQVEEVLSLVSQMVD